MTEYHRLTKLQKGGREEALCAQLSCQDPQVSLAACIKSGDLTTFSGLLADIAPLEDNVQHLSVPDDEKEFPLPEDHWINQPLENENFFNLLQLSVKQPSVEFTRLLVRAGARAGQYNDDLDQAVIHTAVLSGHGEQHLAALLDNPSNRADVNVSLQPGGGTSLHLAAERGLQTCLRMLVDHPGAEIDARDLTGGRTPLFLAAKNKHAECVKMLLENGARLDIKIGNSTTREVIKENLPYFDTGKIKMKERPRRSTVEYLAELVDKRDINNFRKVLPNLSVKEVSSTRVRGMTCLQRAATGGQANFVRLLLDHGVNPNLVTEENTVRPVLIAARRGHHEILSVMLDEGKKRKVETNLAVWTRDTRETVLHMVLKKSHKKAMAGIGTSVELDVQDSNYSQCLDILLSTSDHVSSQLSRIVNKRDLLGNTALHYTVLLWDQERVTSLLNLGANIGVRNMRGEIPLSRILPETLETFLDTCSTHTGHPMNEDFKVEFNYSWLAPPVDDYVADQWDEERQKELEMEGLPETESLWYMAQSKNHKHLLRHPTVTSFLWLKWQRIRKFFSRNIRLYVLFVTCLTWYIFVRFGGVVLNDKTSYSEPGEVTNLMNCSDPGGGKVFCHHMTLNSGSRSGFWYIVFVVEVVILAFMAFRDLRRDCGCSSGNEVVITLISSWFELILAFMAGFLVVFGSGGLWHILVALLGLLCIREVLQMAASIKRYFLSLENILEVVMISLLSLLLFSPNPDKTDCACSTLRHISSVVLLLAWTELIVLVAKHPRLARYNVYISMLQKVLQTFLSFLLWYSLFLIAFAFGFYIMLHQDIPGFTAGPDHYVYFDGPWTSLVKTITMFVGELEFSDIPIDPNSKLSWLSFTFLVVFVFLIVVILMNLLNGLAVSDTGKIMKKAEIVSYISSVETISYMESVLLGDPFDFLSKWPPVSFLSRLPSLALCNKVYSVCPSARRAGHCMTGATGILLFYSLLPDKKKTFPQEDDDQMCGCCNVRKVEDLPEEIMEATRCLVLKKTTASHGTGDSLQKQLELQQQQMDRIESQMKLLLQLINKK